VKRVTVHQTRVFSAPGLLGNTAGVVVWEQEPAPALMHVFLRHADSRQTWCFAWPEHGAVAVRCHGGGRAISFCGHGLLAVANIWLREYGECPVLNTPAARYHTLLENGSLWLRTARLRCRVAAPPEQWRRWFDNAGAGPWRGALAGDAHGYRVLEWPAGTELAALRPNLDAIVSDETCSVIVTQAYPTGDTFFKRHRDWDFSLRYFAPQYGVSEDDATGSANAVLADYWRGRLPGGKGADAVFRARQCSKGGGAVMSRLRGSFVDIGGEFHVIETTAHRLEPDGFSTAAGG